MYFTKSADALAMCKRAYACIQQDAGAGRTHQHEFDNFNGDEERDRDEVGEQDPEGDEEDARKPHAAMCSYNLDRRRIWYNT